MDAATNRGSSKGTAARTKAVAVMNERAASASKGMATSAKSAMLATMKGKSKLKKLKAKAQKTIGKRTRARPWDKPRAMLKRRASIFGTIRSIDEKVSVDMSYATSSKMYEFIAPRHFTIEQDREYKATIIKSEDSLQGSTGGMLETVSLTSSVISFPKFNPDEPTNHPEFPRNARQKKTIIASCGCTEFHTTRKTDLYNILRDRYDPEHSESPYDPLYNFKALCSREALLFHPDVRATLDEIWHITDSDNSNSISFGEYESMHEAMSIAVYGPNYLKKPEKIRRKLCLQDWNLDRDGKDSLDYQRFTMCWFQLADQFTDNISAKDYITYLRSMFFKMVEVDADGVPRWKRDRVIAGLEKSEGKAFTMDLSAEAVKARSMRRQSIRAERKSFEAKKIKEATDAAVAVLDKDAKERREEEEQERERERKRREIWEAEEKLRIQVEEDEKKSREERKTMSKADQESAEMSAAVEAALAAGGTDKALIFDNIMNQYVDRSAFARHYRASGDTEYHRRHSLLRDGHLGDDQTEDEEARRKRMTAFNELEMAKAREEFHMEDNEDDDGDVCSGGEGGKVDDGGDGGDGDDDGRIETLSENKEDVSTIGSGSLKIETESQARARKEEEKNAAIEMVQMDEEEEIMRDMIKKEKIVLKEKEESEAVKRAEIAFRETEERETMEAEEREQKMVEAIIERKRKVAQAKGELMKAEEAEYERHMKRLERKMRKKAPKKGSIHLKGRKTSAVAVLLEPAETQEMLYQAALKAEASGVSGAVRGHKKSIGDLKRFADMEREAAGAPSLEEFQREGLAEVRSRTKMKRVRKLNWASLKKKLAKDKRNPELMSEMQKSMMRRTMATNAEIMSMKAASEKARQERLMNKEIEYGTWDKGSSHLYWSGQDCSVVPTHRTTSLLSGNESQRLWGYGKIREEGREPAFYTGRPVIPIVWNKPPKPEPYVRETEQQQSSPSTSAPNSPSTTSRAVRPSTTGGMRTTASSTQAARTPTRATSASTKFSFTASQPPPNVLSPFSKDPHPLHIRYDFDFKKSIMRDRTIKSAQRRKKVKRRPKTAKGDGNDGRREEYYRDDDGSDVLFAPTVMSPGNLSLGNWSPMMKKKMHKIFGDSVRSTGGGSGVGGEAGYSPMKKLFGSSSSYLGTTSPSPSRPRTGYGKIESRAFSSLQQEQKQEGGEEVDMMKSLEIWTPHSSLVVDNKEGVDKDDNESFASSHVRLIEDTVNV
eukprot:CAMPEP_0118669926 /NCGR_PEP_ID=MMETSP0785-20121206/21170_1 /TAXON_ID=91992 /ORGANISM="Bolidomonas pacifica, Strain CCMP 1866" /LENGTH=1227 /DNA_ID=CAMNT_0006564659 /DNA_START=152 /DNA_END=3831 /DNA_ORIENTATION=-